MTIQKLMPGDRKMGGIFDRFPGATDPGMVKTEGCDLIVEPFAGSGECTVVHLGGTSGIKKAIIADADPTIRAVWNLYQNAEHEKETLKQLHSYRKALATEPKVTWEIIKRRFEEYLKTGQINNTASAAAVSLIYRSVAYAGIVRSGKSSNTLNVSPGRDQLAYIHKKVFRPRLLPPNCEIDIYSDWRLAIQAIPKTAQAVVLIDPPYWSPIGMEPCYPGHRPKHPSTLAAWHYSIMMAMAHPGIKRIVAKNYCGQTTLSGAIRFWPDVNPSITQGWFMEKAVTGVLSLGKKRTGSFKPKNVEAFWFFEKEPFELPKQLVMF
jgi:hypothetical protein